MNNRMDNRMDKRMDNRIESHGGITSTVIKTRAREFHLICDLDIGLQAEKENHRQSHIRIEMVAAAKKARTAMVRTNLAHGHRQTPLETDQDLKPLAVDRRVALARTETT